MPASPGVRFLRTVYPWAYWPLALPARFGIAGRYGREGLQLPRRGRWQQRCGGAAAALLQLVHCLSAFLARRVLADWSC